jgi:low temperature requirement protein LtrA
MTSSPATEVLREPQAPRPISYMELFFDLAFIFGLMQLTRSLTSDLTGPGALRSLLLLAAVWWVWSVTAWSTDWFDPQQPFIRGLLVWVMLGALLLAAAIPRAFDGYAMIFAVTYVAIHLGRGAILMYVLRGHPAALRSARVAVWFTITGVAWIVGALVPPAGRYPLWAVAIVVDATIGLVGYPIPRLGRTSEEQLRVSGPHLTERCAQLAIVAIGEFILVAGIGLRDAGFHPLSTTAFVLAFVNALLFTLIYHVPVGGGLASTVERSRTPGRQALETVYLHLFLLAAILTTAGGYELVIRHADGPIRAKYAILVVAGGALFLAWRIALVLVIGRRVPRWLPLGLVAVIALAAATAHVPPIAVAAIIDLVLVVIALAEWAMTRREAPRTARIPEASSS